MICTEMIEYSFPVLNMVFNANGIWNCFNFIILNSLESIRLCVALVGVYVLVEFVDKREDVRFVLTAGSTAGSSCHLWSDASNPMQDWAPAPQGDGCAEQTTPDLRDQVTFQIIIGTGYFIKTTRYLLALIRTAASEGLVY
jgi:hypothetical protein